MSTSRSRACLFSTAWIGVWLASSACARSGGQPTSPAQTSRIACPHGATARSLDTPRGQEAWCEDGEGKRHGPYAWTYPDGITAQRAGYLDGELDGPFASWHPGGARRAEGAYTAGARVGPWRAWHSNGKPWLDVAYADGVAEGRWLEYDASGTLMFEGSYRAGQLEGAWRALRPGAKEMASGTSARGKLAGTVRFLGRDGTWRWERRYVANRPDGRWQYFVGDRLAYEMTYRAGLLHGPLSDYDEAGRLIEVYQYRDGQLLEAAPVASETTDD